jgi:hypothetical protein
VLTFVFCGCFATDAASVFNGRRQTREMQLKATKALGKRPCVTLCNLELRTAGFVLLNFCQFRLCQRRQLEPEPMRQRRRMFYREVVESETKSEGLR